MKLQKAIKELTQWHKDLQHDKLPDYHDALQLGIEALKYRLELEQTDPEITLEPLPGETYEG